MRSLRGSNAARVFAGLTPRHSGLAGGLNTHDGRLANAPVAAAHGHESVAVADILG